MIKIDPNDSVLGSDRLHGIYRGVVEDNVDPEKKGRCKIRIWGIHTHIKEKKETEGIPTKELPWSDPALGLFEGAVSGFGAWVVPLQGSHVFLFFEGGHILRPVYFASAPGLPFDQNYGMKKSEGFHDPDQKYPVKDTEFPHKPNGLEEPDYHRLSRADGIEETIVQSKTNLRDKKIEMATSHTWNEPLPFYKSEYPNNKVLASHKGITVEIDDTEGEERLHIYHPSNTYLEISNKGDVVFRNELHRYDITLGNRYQHVQVNEHKTIDVDRTKQIGKDQYEWVGATEYRHVIRDAHETIEGAEYIQVYSNVHETFDANEIKKVADNSNETIGGTRIEAIGKNFNQSVAGSRLIGVGGNQGITVLGSEEKMVSSNYSETVMGIKATSVNGNKSDTVIGNRMETTNGNKSELILGGKAETIMLNLSSTVVGNIIINSTGATNITSIGPCSLVSTSMVSLDAPIIAINSGVGKPVPGIPATAGVTPAPPSMPELPLTPLKPIQPKKVAPLEETDTLDIYE